MKSMINSLRLVYPPFSNQEGEWLIKDAEVREHTKNSKIYMIGHRKELKFKDIDIPCLRLEYILSQCTKGESSTPFELCFKLESGELISPTIKLSLQPVLDYIIDYKREVTVEYGDKCFRIIDKENDDVLEWATPDIFLFKYSRSERYSDFHERVTITEPFELKSFSKFELYYVGISKENDSFSRLFKDAHHGRLKILSNETQKNRESRLTDELMLFLFDIEPLVLSSVKTDDDIDDLFFEPDKTKIIADAEKAFIKLMCTKYNTVKYLKFPLSDDGLYDSDLHRYSYHIAEDVTFYTDSVEFIGTSDDIFAKEIDIIGVEGDNANIIKFREQI